MILKINDRFENRKIDFWNQFQLNLVHNSIGSTFSFQSYFDPENIYHKEIFAPSHFHECTVEDEGELLLTGTILKQGFSQSATKQLVGLSGYSRAGVLEDCEIPPTLYPLQFDGLSLHEITSKLLRPFRVGFKVDSSVSAKMRQSFDVSTASESQNIKSFLVELASQKDIVLSHNEHGELLFTQPKTNVPPILTIDTRNRDTDSAYPVTSIRTEFNGQGMHSPIWIQKQASTDGGNASQSSIKNPYVVGSYSFRPKVKSQTSGDDNDTHLAAKRALANELKNFKLTIELDRWRVGGKIIRPNNMISIIAPEVYIYTKENFFVESVTLTGNNEKKTATIQCVLPSVYNGENPVNIYRKINLHPLTDSPNA